MTNNKKQITNNKIEFRPDKENIDEIVCENCFVHLEYMNENDIWISLDNGVEEYHVHIQTNRAKIKTWAEKTK